jgi:WD40 repeat protein
VQVWSLHALPDDSGFVSASADKYVKVWQWARVDAEGAVPRIGVELQKSVNTGQVVLCVRVSPDGNLVAVSLISNVIKVLCLVCKACIYKASLQGFSCRGEINHFFLRRSL